MLEPSSARRPCSHGADRPRPRRRGTIVVGTNDVTHRVTPKRQRACSTARRLELMPAMLTVARVLISTPCSRSLSPSPDVSRALARKMIAAAEAGRGSSAPVRHVVHRERDATSRRLSETGYANMVSVLILVIGDVATEADRVRLCRTRARSSRSRMPPPWSTTPAPSRSRCRPRRPVRLGAASPPRPPTVLRPGSGFGAAWTRGQKPILRSTHDERPIPPGVGRSS